ncbi:MAG: carbohydrate kinase, partial [Chloroflexia bacterium]|nr:carbohydrate kinase [Chloroflexia bacterium]
MVNGSECQLAYDLRTTADGGAEADAERTFDLTLHCLDRLNELVAPRASDLGAVALTSFWHSLLGLDGDGEPATPVFLWADKRSGPDVGALKEELDEHAIHATTGCVPHSSYWPAKLRWLRRVHPATASSVRHWVSFADLLALRFHGELVTTVSMASGTGLLDVHRAEWLDELLDRLDLRRDALPRLVDRTDPLPPLTAAYARRWPNLAGVPWLPSIGDGATANVGAGCVTPDQLALTIGTSGAMRVIKRCDTFAVPADAWCYRLDRERIVLGGALSNGGNVAAWIAEKHGDGDFDGLTARAATLEPDGHGLTVLPFLAGERSPSWNDEATGTIHGLTLTTDQADLFRAALEAIAYRFAGIYDALADIAGAEHVIHANGAAILRSPLWLQIIADTLNHPVVALREEAEASARGTAICALDAIGARNDLSPPLPIDATYLPDTDRHRRYAAARHRQRRLELALYP